MASNDAVFVASWYDGRVYKFSLSGELLSWYSINAEPISIVQREDKIVALHNNVETVIDARGFNIASNHDVVASVKRTWWGQSMLIVQQNGTEFTSPLQPWYLTLFQSPYPGGLWLPLAFVAFFLWRCLKSGSEFAETPR